MQFDELYPAIEVGPEVIFVHNVFSLWKERVHELATKRTGTYKVLVAELELLFTRNFSVDIHRI